MRYLLPNLADFTDDMTDKKQQTTCLHSPCEVKDWCMSLHDIVGYCGTPG